MLISLIVVVFLPLSKSPFFWHLRNLLFPTQRLQKQTLEILIALVTPYAKEKMTPPHQCMAQAEESCQFSSFPPPVLPWSGKAGIPWRWAEELAKAPKRSHFLLAALCCAELLLVISLLLSLFGQVTDTHSPLSFLPWHAGEVRTAEKGLLLTCHWLFFHLSYSKSNY